MERNPRGRGGFVCLSIGVQVIIYKSEVKIWEVAAFGPFEADVAGSGTFWVNLIHALGKVSNYFKVIGLRDFNGWIDNQKKKKKRCHSRCFWGCRREFEWKELIDFSEERNTYVNNKFFQHKSLCK